MKNLAILYFFLLEIIVFLVSNNSVKNITVKKFGPQKITYITDLLKNGVLVHG